MCKIVSQWVCLAILQLYMYALNTPKSGKLRGLTGADYACYKEAYYSGMYGRTFRAFLASKTQNLYSIVSDKNIPIVNKNVSYYNNTVLNQSLKL